MSEQQFWEANPRIIKVWEKAFREQENHKNFMNYVLGGYVYSAVSVAVGKALNGKKYKGEYPDKPSRIFPMTEEEKQIEQEKALSQAIAFFDGMEKKGTERRRNM